MTNLPSVIATAGATLFATRLDLVSVGFNRPDVPPCLWLNVYDECIRAARVHSPSLKSPNNAPPGCSSLQFEIYCSVRRPQEMSADELRANCVAVLRTMGLATEADIAFVHHKHRPFANVVFDLGMEARRGMVRDWVEAQGILLAGRFGEWDYLGTHQSFMSGFRAGAKMIRDD